MSTFAEIRERRSERVLNAAKIARHRHLIYHLASADVRASYADAMLGPLWVVLNPLLLAGVYFFLVTVLSNADRDPLTFLGSLLAGLFTFYLTRTAVLSGSRSILAGTGLVTNSAVPRLVLPLAAVVSAAMQFGGMMLVYFAFHLAAGFPVGLHLLLLPAVLVAQLGLCIGLASALAVVTVHVRDVARTLGYVTRIWLYLSPVLWLPAELPRWAADLLWLNPMSAVLLCWRTLLVDGRVPAAGLWLQAFIWACVALLVGLTIFRRYELGLAVRL